MNRDLSVSHFFLRSAFAGAALVAAALAGAQKPSLTQVARVTLANGPVPAIARSSRLAVAVPTETIEATLALQPRDLAGLEAFAESVSDPKSPNYHHFITPEEVGQRFGASAENRRAVTDFLSSKGLSVSLVAPNGMAIIAKGSAANWENAFGTKLAYFRGPDAGGLQTVNYRANTTALTVPASISRIVTFVSGLDTNNRPMRRATTATLQPQFISSAYNSTPTLNFGYRGQGRHIAFSNFDGLRVADAATYVQYYGLPYPAAGPASNVSIVSVGSPQYTGSRQGEGDLDLQMEIGQAPLADIRIYDSSSDLLGVLTREASDNWADVISESWGWSAGGDETQRTATWNAWHNQHLAMSAQGITYLAASGDSSTHLSPYSYPDFDPEVLMVGGSITTVDSTTGARISDTGWSYSGGGWFNTSTSGLNALPWNTLPSWQKGTGVPTNINRRLVPDVSFQAGANNNSNFSPGGVFVVYTASSGPYANQTYIYTFDGTSCASPIFAGMLGSMESRLYASSTAPRNTQRLGRLQNLIYAQNGRSDVYHDITIGNGLYGLPTSSTGNTNSSYTGGSQSALPGWDFLTGWGTIDMNAFYKSFIGGR
jgi:subtilase family serine protease